MAPATRVAVLLLLAAVLATAAPAKPHYYTEQLVDHFSVDSATFSQRYYMNDTFFAGPGHPIFVIMGGEGAIEPSTGIYYPWVLDLAQKFGALVIEPENRFYGETLPAGPYDAENLSLLTPMQALEDAVRFVTHIQAENKCGGKHYNQPRCPVMTFGGSYPGWMSAMMRLRYPAVVDMAYSASAPMKFYTQDVEQYAYYKVVTDAAEYNAPGCPAAVRSMLKNMAAAPKEDIVSKLGLCTPLPEYLATGDVGTLVDELNMVVMYTFANLNMGAYPPGPKTALATSCQALMAAVGAGDSWGALKAFLAEFVKPQALAAHAFPAPSPAAASVLANLRAGGACIDLSTQLPAGPHATITSGDWSGVGVGQSGASWDYSTCTYLVEHIGVNGETDMFLPRPFTLEWLNAHCAARFGVTPQPRALADLWGFDRWDELPTSRIIFTNGLLDGWSVGGWTKAVPEKDIHVFQLPNGAHHSDLGHSAPGPQDTPDVQKCHEDSENLIARWLKEISAANESVV